MYKRLFFGYQSVRKRMRSIRNHSRRFKKCRTLKNFDRLTDMAFHQKSKSSKWNLLSLKYLYYVLFTSLEQISIYEINEIMKIFMMILLLFRLDNVWNLSDLNNIFFYIEIFNLELVLFLRQLVMIHGVWNQPHNPNCHKRHRTV